LKESGGVKYLVFDKDNTLTIPYERQIHPSITHQFNSLIALYGRENIAILSNSVGSKEDKEYKEAIIIEEALGVKVIRHVNKKPEVNEDVLVHFGTKEPSSIAMIGDRILSDCVMGNTHGYFTIYCEPFDTRPENFMVKLMRRVEGQIIPLVAPSSAVEHVVIDKLKDNNKSISDLIN
jgi:phosphatidylglycerophosphatase GEP4